MLWKEHSVQSQKAKVQGTVKSPTCICDMKPLSACRWESLICRQKSQHLCILPKAGGKQMCVQACSTVSTNTGGGEIIGDGHQGYMIPISHWSRTLPATQSASVPAQAGSEALHEEIQEGQFPGLSTCRNGQLPFCVEDPVCWPQAADTEFSPSTICQLAMLLVSGFSFTVIFAFCSWDWFSWQKELCNNSVKQIVLGLVFLDTLKFSLSTMWGPEKLRLFPMAERILIRALSNL